MQINICFVPCSKRTTLCKAGFFKLNFFIMKKAKLAPGMESYTDAAFENKTQSIYVSMLNNVYFPNPTPALTELDLAVKPYSDALLAAQSRGKNEIALKNQARGNARRNGDSACKLGNDYRQWRQSQTGEYPVFLWLKMENLLRFPSLRICRLLTVSMRANW